MNHTPSKLPKVGVTIFSQMSALAARHQAINLSQGFPEFDTPEYLKTRLAFHCKDGKNQYSPSSGLPQLQEQIGALVKRKYGLATAAHETVTITSGATEALFAAIHSVVHAGDEVIVFDPAYDSYAPAIKLAGGTSIHIPLRAPDYRIDMQVLAGKITARTRAILLNTPHNPTGKIITASELQQIKSLVLEHKLILISDEVYEHIVFDNKAHHSVLSDPELFQSSLVISSFGKSFHCTGWKMGYCLAPTHLAAEFRKVHQFLTFSSFTPAQYALADMLEHRPEHIDELSGFYQHKRDVLVNALSKSKFKLLATEGSYFLNLDYSAISELNDIEFSRWLTTEVGVASIPVSVFYKTPPEQNIIRLCFAKEDTTLLKAAEKLCKL